MRASEPASVRVTATPVTAVTTPAVLSFPREDIPYLMDTDATDFKVSAALL